MKKNNKKMIRSLVGLLLVAVMAMTIGLNPVSVKAADRFPGVQILVNQTSAQEPFTILEVVAKKDDASLGFYLQGSEPFSVDDEGYAVSFDETITSFASAKDRADYMTALLSKLAGTYYDAEAENPVGTAQDFPLIYNSYEETYFLSDTTNGQWKTVELEEIQQVTLKGSFEPVGLDEEGNALVGDYVKNENAYVAVTDGTGTYVENIAAFYSSEDPKNYNVTFAEVPENYLENAELTEEVKTAIAESIGKYGVYLPMSEDDTTNTFFYDGPAIDTSSELTFYYVSSYEFVGDDQGTYGVRYKDGEEKYIPCEEGQVGTHKKDDDSYALLEDLGNYNFVLDPNGEECTVEVSRYYYKGGFINNNWFKEKVFLFGEDDLLVNSFPTLVKTVTIEQLTENSFEDVDLLVVNGTDAAVFNKINANVANALVLKINRAKFPCVINSELMTVQDSVFFEYMQNFFVSTDTDKNFVEESVFWHTGSVFNVNLGKVFDSTKNEDKGFEDILEYIAEENEYRALENLAPLTRNLSQAVAIEYVLGRQSARNISVKENLTVLEIEPCADYFFVDNTNSSAEDKVRDLMGYSEQDMPDNKIAIVQMTTAEFIGKIEDLNGKYDFIYIGMQTGKMNKDSNGNTLYNDTAMNGYVYTNIGDAVIGSERISGLLNTDFPQYTNAQGQTVFGYYPYDEEVYGLRTKMENGKLVMDTATINAFDIRTEGGGWVRDQKVTYGNVGVYRYAGNDITKEKMNNLREYITAGYPIILDNQFYTVDSSGNRVINDKKIDNSSYLYELLNGNTEDNIAGIWGRDNLFFYQDIVATNADEATLDKFQFYMAIPKLKINFASRPANALDSQYVQADENGKFYLSYTFSITDEAAASPASTEYTATLYVDMNADGKYSRTTEALTDAIVVDIGTGLTVESDELIAGKYYTLKRQIPEGFKSIVPWKLEVKQTNRSLIRQSEEGYAGLRNDGAKEVIKVLQIFSDRSGNSNKGTWDLKGTAFKNLLSQIQDFDIQIDQIYTNQYEDNYDDDSYYEYLDQYDMLILGFDDAYQDFTKQTSVNAIKQYINSGKSVLFTHDTTSFNNFLGSQSNQSNGTLNTMNTSDYRWGYQFNTWIRDMVGMDRYGITAEATRDILKQGKILNSGEADFATITNSGKDVAYVVGSNRTQTYPETQGFVYLSLNISRDEVASGKRLPYYNLHTSTDVNYQGSNDNGAMPNMYVTAVNKGQITSYPFELPDSFKVADTHSQYYQLDLNADKDNDKESDIVVWYCISDTTSRAADMYSASPNDVRNNYYIYSIGNVFYSGVGHSNVSDQNEMKLFVNTMVAAYSAKITKPLVNTVAQEDAEAQAASTVRLPIEYSMENDTDIYLDDMPLQFFYTINDTNFVSAGIDGNAKELYVKYYLETGDPADPLIPNVGDGTLRGIEITEQIATSRDTNVINIVDGQVPVESGKAYTGTISMTNIQSYIGTADSVKIHIRVSSSFMYYGTPSLQFGSDTVYVKKTHLFDLD